MTDGAPTVAPPLGDPTAWVLDPSVVHANHGSFGGLTRATWEAVTAARAEVAANPMRFFERAWPAVHADALAVVADLLGATPGTLQLVANATAGLDLALRVLPWRDGARIVRTDHAYPSVVGALDAAAARVGAHVEVVPVDLDASPDAVLDLLAAAGAGADGMVVDAVTSATARWVPVDALVPRLRDAGTTVVVDGAHVPGHVPVDVTSLGADAWVGNLHKWACAPPSLAAVVLDPVHHDRVGPLLHSATSARLPFPDGSAWAGTADAGALCVAAQVVAQARAVLHAHGGALTARAAAGAEEVAAAVGGQVPPHGAGWLRLVELPGSAGTGPARARELQDGMASRGVEAKVSAWRDRLLLRLSTHVYSRPDDPTRTADALRGALAG